MVGKIKMTDRAKARRATTLARRDINKNDYRWALPEASRAMKKDGWKPAFRRSQGGIKLWVRERKLPPKTTRKDIEELHAYLGKWLIAHR